MTNSELFRALKDIQAKDPDGGQIEPTEGMYQAHRDWAIRTYGVETYNTYMLEIRDYRHDHDVSEWQL